MAKPVRMEKPRPIHDEIEREPESVRGCASETGSAADSGEGPEARAADAGARLNAACSRLGRPDPRLAAEARMADPQDGGEPQRAPPR